MADERMKSIFHRWAAGALSLAITALAALPALAAPANPRIVGTATLAAGSGDAVLVTTTGAINGGDAIVVIAASEANMRPLEVSCGVCEIGVSTAPNDPWNGPFPPSGKVSQAEARTFIAWAREDLPTGRQFQVRFAGKAGAKSVTIVAVSSAQLYGLTSNGSNYWGAGSGTAIGWSCTTNCTIAADLMMVNASVIPGGGSDSYTEDAGWTFLHQTAAGAWPAIRIAFKPSGAGGTFSYGLTNGTSRSWISGAVLLK